MKFRYVVSFGDSWTYGDELTNPDKDSFTTLIANQFNAIPRNCGEPGSSQIATRNLFQQYLMQRKKYIHDTLFLIGLTGSHRWSWTDGSVAENLSQDILIFNNHIDSTNIDNVDNDWKQMIKLYTSKVHSNYSEKINHYESLLFFDGIAARNNLKLVQFNYFDMYNIEFLDVPTHVQKVPFDRILPANMRAPGKHPNELGHKFIADTLLPKIKELYD